MIDYHVNNGAVQPLQNVHTTQYKQCLDELLLLIEIPTDCIKCTDYSHIVSIQNFHDSIIALCLKASKVLPISKKSETIPG